MNDTSAKQQIVEKIRDSSNILVTVSKNPSVDELSAALGLTALLNKMDKHAAAVFSGAVPPAIQFLNPDKTFENTPDSLRDFIIALDKEKADHLRYKVEGDVVKIFITPYRTTIDESDLDFSQGDYNIELVLALGVTAQDQLDHALEAHGRIFHDATVATLTAGSISSNLGSISWNERGASSLSEMLVSLADALKTSKPLLDEQISTAFLTGIVAVTDRFSNNLTSSKVMTVAAQLMAAGANQQLIAAKLEEADAISGEQTANHDGSTTLTEDKQTKLKKGKSSTSPAQQPPQKRDGLGELSIAHEKKGDLDTVAQQVVEEEQSQAATEAENELARQLDKVQSAPDESLSLANLQKDLASAESDVDAAADTLAPAPPAPEPPVAQPVNDQTEPSLGGTLNATTEEAAEEKRREDESDRNKTILSHEGNSYMGSTQPTYDTPLNSSVDPHNDDNQKPLDDPMAEVSAPTTPVAPVVPPMSSMTLDQIDRENRTPHEAAREDIAAAYNNVQPTPATAPQPFTPPPMPPMPDFSTLPPLPPLPSFPPAPAGQNDLGASAQPTANPFIDPSAGQPDQASSQTQASDPGQFRIPGA
ncbi:MAG TPA: hypothetical protein VFQ70_01055 [Candidatus Saccharimonadaceae bacterium]|nr:hypothetical protein [Candidatus Saccharimonadaceae bacterium]